VGDSYDWLKIGLREVKALEALRQHPNIVNYKHSWLEMDTLADFGPIVPCLHILMEYVDGGNFFFRL
jgi:serine/threonine protein kinase